MSDYEKDLEMLKRITKDAEYLGKKYKCRLSVDGTNKLRLAMATVNLYGFEAKDIYIGRFALRFVDVEYRLTNQEQGGAYTDDLPKYFLLLENGNIGAYAFAGNDSLYFRMRNSDVYKSFKEKMNELSFFYDPLNSYWLFVPSKEVVEQIRSEIEETQRFFDAEYKAMRKEELQKELERLGGDER